MNSLTKSLIKDFLPESIGGKEVTALFGGGFKPPTAGHLEVIQKAIKNHPEIFIDMLKIILKILYIGL